MNNLLKRKEEKEKIVHTSLSMHGKGQEDTQENGYLYVGKPVYPFYCFKFHHVHVLAFITI